MKKIGDNWIGDIVETLLTLKPEDGNTKEVILKLLGFKPEFQIEEIKNQELISTPRTELDEQVKRDSDSVEPLQENKPKQDRNVPKVLEPIDTKINSRIDWFETPSIAPPLTRETIKPLPYDSLFDPRWIRGILQASLSTDAPGEVIDQEELISAIAKQKSIEKLPYLSHPSLFRGIQVLIDISDAMEPFARDQDELVKKIYQVIGKDLVSIISFKNCPLREAGSGPIWEWKPYTAPSYEIPVIILSDLGIGGPLIFPERSQVNEWLELTKLLKQNSCPLIAYVPYPKERWPKQLIGRMNIVYWDRSANISDIKKQMIIQ